MPPRLRTGYLSVIASPWLIVTDELKPVAVTEDVFIHPDDDSYACVIRGEGLKELPQGTKLYTRPALPDAEVTRRKIEHLSTVIGTASNALNAAQSEIDRMLKEISK